MLIMVDWQAWSQDATNKQLFCFIVSVPLLPFRFLKCALFAHVCIVDAYIFGRRRPRKWGSNCPTSVWHFHPKLPVPASDNKKTPELSGLLPVPHHGMLGKVAQWQCGRVMMRDDESRHLLNTNCMSFSTVWSDFTTFVGLMYELRLLRLDLSLRQKCIFGFPATIQTDWTIPNTLPQLCTAFSRERSNYSIAKLKA